ncbi:hypothetical protein AWZ03_006123 [Drosophila navojoa]|uniref:C2H2-type domain-containing protein n=1 Tax=Drosophila navojoa TaxID=7232 RepID=A0A484BHW4_DRONA|nr:hypothetical protein AWZ03_006123 [Drosophila navojoa]
MVRIKFASWPEDNKECDACRCLLLCAESRALPRNAGARTCSAASFAARATEPGSRPGSQAASCIVRTNTVAFGTGTAPVHWLLLLLLAPSAKSQESRVMQATALNYYVERSDYESCGESEASPGCPSSVASTASSRASTPATSSQHRRHSLSHNQSQHQSKKFRCTWKGCDIVEPTQMKIERHVRDIHLRQQQQQQQQ